MYKYDDVTLISGDPQVEVLADMKLNHDGVLRMASWVQKYRPNCVPEGGFKTIYDLLPHDGYDASMKYTVGNTTTCTERLRKVTDNELLAEIAGRKCYDSFGEAGKKRLNSEYLRSMWGDRIPHRSTGYHPKATFFFAEVSRRVSHELIRNYVGADRDEEGCPSQESTRFTHHPGIYIIPPRDVGDPTKVAHFAVEVRRGYRTYQDYIQDEIDTYKLRHGEEPKGLERKRIYEAGSFYLHHSCGTSWIWTTNPMAAYKFFVERDDEAADLEMCRFARAYKRVALAWWPNLFPLLVTPFVEG